MVGPDIPAYLGQPAPTADFDSTLGMMPTLDVEALAVEAPSVLGSPTKRDHRFRLKGNAVRSERDAYGGWDDRIEFERQLSVVVDACKEPDGGLRSRG